MNCKLVIMISLPSWVSWSTPSRPSMSSQRALIPGGPTRGSGVGGKQSQRWLPVKQSLTLDLWGTSLFLVAVPCCPLVAMLSPGCLPASRALWATWEWCLKGHSESQNEKLKPHLPEPFCPFLEAKKEDGCLWKAPDVPFRNFLLTVTPYSEFLGGSSARVPGKAL